MIGTSKAHLETFVQVLRSLNRTHYLLMLFPQLEVPKALTPAERLQQTIEQRIGRESS